MRIKPITEEEFTRQVITFAKLHGWLVAHFRPAKTNRGWRTAMAGDVGFPDLLMAKGGRVIAAELKVGRNRPTDEQRRWLEELDGEGVRTFCWTPDDWQTIERVIGGT